MAEDCLPPSLFEGPLMKVMGEFLTGFFSPFPSVIRPDFIFEVRHFIGGDQTGSYRAVDIAVDLYD